VLTWAAVTERQNKRFAAVAIIRAVPKFVGLIFVIAVLGLITAIRLHKRRTRVLPPDPLARWQEEIRNVVREHGSPDKAANHFERWSNLFDPSALSDAELKTLSEYWHGLSSGKPRLDLSKLDPERKWSSVSWTQMFNSIGTINLIVTGAWDARCAERTEGPSR
jgi:hypothetical protein